MGMPGVKDVATKVKPSLVRQLDLNLLKIFREIAHAGGISAAARRLDLQQPTVSLALKRIEDHLAVRLCERGARGIELTAAGRVVANFAEQIYQGVQALPQSVAAAGGIEGTLTIRAISSVSCRAFDNALASLRSRHPGIRVRIDIAPRRIVLQALLKDTAEVCISFDGAPRADLLYEPLTREFQQIYCNRDHPNFGTKITRPEMLRDERFVVTGSDEPDEVRNMRLRYQLGIEAMGEAENLTEARRLIEIGIGIGFLPTHLVDGGGRRDRLWAMLPDAMLPNYLLYLITKPETQQTAPTQLFLAEMRRRLSASGLPI